MTAPVSSTARLPDLSTCDREPIHIPGAIQPHGALVAVSENLSCIDYISANSADFLGKTPAELLGQPLAMLLPASVQEPVRNVLAGTDLAEIPTRILTIAPLAKPLDVIAHRHAGKVVLEFEVAAPAPDHALNVIYPRLHAAIARIEKASSLETLFHAGAEEVRRISGFDRVMIYRFDTDWHGWVVGEARAADARSYMDHHFPASDIPTQARELYRRNRCRVIADASHHPVAILGLAAEGGGSDGARPLDLSHALLRAVSPVHLEYLRNMGVVGSTSFSIVREGKLWGLIACHHRAPMPVPFEVRTACEFLSQVIALQVGAQVTAAHDRRRLHLQESQTRLLAAMSQEDTLTQSLSKSRPQLLEFLDATGAAIYIDRQLTLLGDTPSEEQVHALLEFLSAQRDQELFATDGLPSQMPAASAFKDKACGLLALRISRFANAYLLWFRPERIRTVTWGGDPTKPAEFAGLDGSTPRISPRKSFENWKQIVEGHSVPWLREEIDAAREFLSALVNIVLKKTEELAELSSDLQRANAELEAFSYSVSHDLRAPFRHITGFSDLLQRRAAASLDDTSKRYVATIGQAAKHAGALVDALLAFSHVARLQMRKATFPFTDLVQDVTRDLAPDAAGRDVQWVIGELPTITGDPVLLRLVLQNLLANALKFSRDQQKTIIEIHARPDGKLFVFSVRDNGIGFDATYVHKLFTPFQRLHQAEEFEGTGIGLANVKRIIERHGGTVWAESVPGQGATFSFTLPQQEPV